MTTPSARRHRHPVREESPSPERVRDIPMLDDPFVVMQNDNVSQQLRQMENDRNASRTTVSDLRTQLAALSVPHRAAARGRLRGSNASRAVPDPNAIQQASESSHDRGGSRGRGRGRGRPRQAERRAPPVNPNYKMALQPTSILLQQLSVHYLGRMDVACPDCDALHWEAEKMAQTSRVNNPKFGKCCKTGKVSLPRHPGPPELLQRLLTENTTEANRFRLNIRAINQSFAFVSVGVHNDDTVTRRTGPTCFRIRGELHHKLGSLLPSEPTVDPETGIERPSKNVFLQIYIHDGDTDEAVSLRRSYSNLPQNISDTLTRQLQTMLHEYNPYVAVFQQAHEIIASKPAHERLDVSAALTMQESNDPHRYNIPTVREVAAIIPDGFGQEGGTKDLIVRYKDSALRRISDCSPLYQPLYYVLLFPHGESGWHPEIPLVDTNNGKQEYVTRMEYYAYYIHYRLTHPSTLFLCKKLFHQYLVNGWAITEQSKLKWIENNQKTLRADSYKGLMDTLATDQGEDELRNLGKRVILPSGHVNSTRFMHQLFQDSMAICCSYSHPDLFITFTANPQWKEVVDELLPGQTYAD
jgi:Helitron helicase-like domain at N-terminus